MVSDNPAVGRVTCAYIQAAIRVDGEQGVRGSLTTAAKRVTRPASFLGDLHHGFPTEETERALRPAIHAAK
jgi:hypothetical protein